MCPGKRYSGIQIYVICKVSVCILFQQNLFVHVMYENFDETSTAIILIIRQPACLYVRYKGLLVDQRAAANETWRRPRGLLRGPGRQVGAGSTGRRPGDWPRGAPARGGIFARYILK